MAASTGGASARLEFLWALKAPSKRGPRPSLSVERIVRTGIELADSEGLDAVSMQRLAKALGVGTMSLYTYVPDKGTLLEAMFDAALDGSLPAYAGQGWRAYLEQCARQLFDAYRRHPWAVQIVVGGPPVAPNQIAFLESALASLADTGLADEAMLEAVMVVVFYVRGAAQIAVGVTGSEQQATLTDTELRDAYGQAYNWILDPRRFPLLARVMLGSVLAGGGTEGEPYEFGFRFGLERILDGIALRIGPDA